MLFHETEGNGSDVDRNDFFQINTYMNFYNNQNQYDLIAGGLLYPIEAKFDKDKCYSNTWLGNNAVQFVVDGIDLDNLEYNEADEDAMDKIKQSETEFIARIDAMGRDTSLGKAA